MLCERMTRTKELKSRNVIFGDSKDEKHINFVNFQNIFYVFYDNRFYIFQNDTTETVYLKRYETMCLYIYHILYFKKCFIIQVENYHLHLAVTFPINIMMEMIK